MAKIEVFTAGCPLCEPAISAAKEGSCPNCEVLVYNVCADGIAEKAAAYGITSIPTIVVNGQILSCCPQGAPSADAVRSARLAPH